MTISPELYLSILALDAYNRGYNSGFAGLSETPGTAIGTASINNVPLPSGAAAVGFYAVAYSTPYGTVTSYRGTDNFGVLSNWEDVSNGYSVAAQTLI